jgi:alpha-L-fucosidase
MPPECDVSIRPGWFWHEAEDSRVKTPRQLLDLYYRSVGRGGSLLLNVPPDRRGLLHDNDLAALRGFGDLVRDSFRENLAARARVTVSNIRAGDMKAFGPHNLIDHDRHSYWTVDDGMKTPEAVFTFVRPVTFNIVRLRENLPLGQRVDAFELDRWKDGAWETFEKSTSIGSCRLVRTRQDLSTTQVRLRITQAAACPAISDFGLFLESRNL